MLYWRWVNHPRHPLARLLLASIGAVLLAGILVFGFFALIAFAFVGTIIAVVRALSRAHTASSATAHGDPRVIEGEYVVLQPDAATLKR